jgi:protein-disulfide isomerase
MGVREVPAIFINGERYTGLPSLAQLSKAVKSALNQEKAKRA